MALVFISGGITGKDNYLEEFAKAEEYLKNKGYGVVNPARILDCFPKDIMNYSDCMDIAIMLLKKCDVIYSLRGWRSSTGANFERRFANEHGLKLTEEQEGDFR